MGSFQTYHKLFIVLVPGAISQTRVDDDVIFIAEYDIIMRSCLNTALVMLLYKYHHSTKLYHEFVAVCIVTSAQHK